MSASHQRFSLLSHDFPHPHFDLLLEWGEACRTWRLKEDPRTHSLCHYERLAPHRKLYLTYEGPVSGNRGEVRQLLNGTWEAIEGSATAPCSPTLPPEAQRLTAAEDFPPGVRLRDSSGRVLMELFVQESDECSSMKIRQFNPPAASVED